MKLENIAHVDERFVIHFLTSIGSCITEPACIRGCLALLRIYLNIYLEVFLSITPPIK